MRFVVTGEWTRNDLLKVIVVFFLLYTTVFALTNLLMFTHQMGFSYQGVVEYYLGSEEKFLQPRSYQGLLEVSHMHFFAMGILMLTLTHLILFAPIKISAKVFFILTAFSSAFCDEVSSWLVRFVHPSFAYLKLISFAALETSLFLLIVVILWALLTNAPSDYTASQKKRERPLEDPTCQV